MLSEHRKDLARIGAESADQVRNARSSCKQAKDHVQSSRVAVARSLDLLARTSRKLAD